MGLMRFKRAPQAATGHQRRKTAAKHAERFAAVNHPVLMLQLFEPEVTPPSSSFRLERLLIVGLLKITLFRIPHSVERNLGSS